MELRRKTIENDEEYLRQTSLPVDFQNDNYMEYIDSLKSYCRTAIVFALAPIQIGIPKRLIYIRNTSQDMKNNYAEEYDESILYINPTIISSKGHTKFLEACDSCKVTKNGKLVYYAGIVDRPYSIEIEYYDIHGVKHQKTIEGFEATVFSHEYDHLNGILHMDKSSEIFEMTLEEMQAYRKEHPYEILSKDCEFPPKQKLITKS